MEKFIVKISAYLNWGAKISILAMMLIVTGNIIFGLVGKSIFGTYEIASFLTAIVISFALAFCCLQGGHVNVSFVMEKFPHGVQKTVGIITGIISVAVSFLFAWRCAMYATEMWRIGEVSGTLRIPLHPIMYLIGLGMLLMALTFLLELITIIKSSSNISELQELEDVK